jgi:hypothetical protein
MPEFQPAASAYISAIQRPGCPQCRQNRMLLAKFEAGPPGFDSRTFECQKCGRVETTIASRDPIPCGMRGWLAGLLKPAR